MLTHRARCWLKPGPSVSPAPPPTPSLRIHYRPHLSQPLPHFPASPLPVPNMPRHPHFPAPKWDVNPPSKCPPEYPAGPEAACGSPLPSRRLREQGSHQRSPGSPPHFQRGRPRQAGAPPPHQGLGWSRDSLRGIFGSRVPSFPRTSHPKSEIPPSSQPSSPSPHPLPQDPGVRTPGLGGQRQGGCRRLRRALRARSGPATARPQRSRPGTTWAHPRESRARAPGGGLPARPGAESRRRGLPWEKVSERVRIQTRRLSMLPAARRAGAPSWRPSAGRGREEGAGPEPAPGPAHARAHAHTHSHARSPARTNSLPCPALPCALGPQPWPPPSRPPRPPRSRPRPGPALSRRVLLLAQLALSGALPLSAPPGPPLPSLPAPPDVSSPSPPPALRPPACTHTPRGD